MGLNKLLISNVNSVQNAKNLSGDAFEALIGSIFLDKGFRRSKKLVIDKIISRYLDLDSIIRTDTDYKSLVFEWVQKNKAQLTFTYNEEYDFDQKKSFFSSTLYINKEEYGKGHGSSKKEAEQEASCKGWKKITDINCLPG
jgi:ribonuclease-3